MRKPTEALWIDPSPQPHPLEILYFPPLQSISLYFCSQPFCSLERGQALWTGWHRPGGVWKEICCSRQKVGSLGLCRRHDIWEFLMSSHCVESQRLEWNTVGSRFTTVRFTTVRFTTIHFYDPCSSDRALPTCGTSLSQLKRPSLLNALLPLFHCTCVSSFSVLVQFF